MCSFSDGSSHIKLLKSYFIVTDVRHRAPRQLLSLGREFCEEFSKSFQTAKFKQNLISELARAQP